MDNSRTCPNCGQTLASFFLKDNDPENRIVFTSVLVQQNLAHTGLICRYCKIHFGYQLDTLVKIEFSLNHNLRLPHPNPAITERAGDWIARFVLKHWPRWVFCPHRVQMFLRDQLIFPWQVASSWWVAYDPNVKTKINPDLETQILSDAAIERLGEGDDPADRVSDYWNDDTDGYYSYRPGDEDTESDESSSGSDAWDGEK